MSTTETKPANGLAYELITNQIVEMLEAGTVPWHRPWSSIGLPLSMSTGKPYRGINPFLLNMAGLTGAYDSRWWGTFKQIAERGGQVRKGEKSTMIVFYKRSTSKVIDADGEEATKSWAMLRYFRVFNLDQSDWADGIPAKFVAPPLAEHEPIAEAEAVFNGYLERAGSPRSQSGGDRSYYSPSEDLISLPKIGRFESPESFYSAAFHEAVHSTGHHSRLKREGLMQGHSFGDPIYSREELVAELGASMLCGHVGIAQTTLESSAAYLSSWVTTLKGDSRLVIGAAGAAQKAADLILGTTFDKEDA